MKYSIIALSMVAVMGLGACTNGGSWTPMSAGRTAGEGTYVVKAAPVHHKADVVFSKSMRK